MELQGQPSSGGALAVLRQPSPDGRQWPHHARDTQPATILLLEQIRPVRGSNEYTEGPSASKRPGPRWAPRPEKQERTHEIPPSNVNSSPEHPAGGQAAAGHVQQAARPPVLSRSTSTGSAASSGSSNSSASSEQGLLGRCPPSKPGQRREPTVRLQPAKACGKGAPAGEGREVVEGQHRFICEHCGRCKCGDCRAPRALPSCLACDRQCLCSAESLVEYGTCMCLVKGLFYHCSEDDQGDSSADSPCSCSRAHCCSRYLCMGALALLLPCLLCYPPAKGCLRLCRGCYDRARRPGCRCKNSNTVYCKLESAPPDLRGREKPS
ncbi:protein sprouty homolog 1 [Rhinatrema bivittatum]|uniref:protein sprouty homolog 1 n=1 Tax=Rhinatrema bivittatum TaxID=194408 RepID=UPI00112C44B3|nr:protein sprouty homolog 1 [Rhinatrema bivittatum]XP_029444070.1 protein sprouty homolog 1 [Rhinatrema bivittatum]XP_029444158.1 protein sprouty homolog 1 [Rhinatrema bivittatum]XP_029444236.1 protein sprouty homolog 1 [Rhinatrema bivittatum]